MEPYRCMRFAIEKFCFLMAHGIRKSCSLKDQRAVMSRIVSWGFVFVVWYSFWFLFDWKHKQSWWNCIVARTLQLKSFFLVVHVIRKSCSSKYHRVAMSRIVSWGFVFVVWYSFWFLLDWKHKQSCWNCIVACTLQLNSFFWWFMLSGRVVHLNTNETLFLV